MIFEAAYTILSLTLVAYTIWQYHTQKEKSTLYLTAAFTFLAASNVLNLIQTSIYYYLLPVTYATVKAIELGALAFFACFTATAVLAIAKTTKHTSTSPTEANGKKVSISHT